MKRDVRMGGAPSVLKGLRLTEHVRSLTYLREAKSIDPSPADPDPTGPLSPRTGAEASAASPSSEALLTSALAEAERSGYQQGLANGRKDAERELARDKAALVKRMGEAEAERQKSIYAVLERLEQALGDARQEQRLFRERIAEYSVGLAFAAICQMLGKRDGHRETLQQLIETALDRWPGEPVPVLRLGRDDHALLMGEVADPRLKTLLARVTLLVDPSLGAMEAQLEDTDGGLDIGLETQLKALRDLWTEGVSAVDGHERLVPPSSTMLPDSVSLER